MNADVHTMTGAYALDALPAAERDAFEDHLALCAACRRELAELQETAGRLGAAVATPPPAQLRASVLGAVRGVRQLPPDEGPIIPIRGRRWPLRAAVAAAAAGIVAAMALGVQVLRSDQRLDDADRSLAQARQERAELTAVLTAPDARVIVSREQGMRATVVVSRERGKVAFVPQDLRSLGAKRTYQLWLISPDGARSAGVLDAQPVVSDASPSATTLGVTVEPRGGSKQPTAEPVLVVALPR